MLVFKIRNDLIKSQNTIKSQNINSNKLNISTTNKTIIHIFDYFKTGFGDFLRGSIFLCQYAKQYNINIQLNAQKHEIYNYLDSDNNITVSLSNIKITFIKTIMPMHKTMFSSLFNKFIESKEEKLYINTNLFYNKQFVSDDIKDYINSFFKFKQFYYNKAKELTKFDKYNVLHIRCLDEYFNKEFNSDKLLVEIVKLQLPYNTIVLSNNFSIKTKINKLFGFHYIDNIAHHTGNKSNNCKDFESTIIDYIILSKSCYIYCFSYYDHGSGFSEQCSVLNNIPYKLILLNKEILISNNETKLLFRHYDDLLDKNSTIHLPISIEKTNNSYDNISFITLTNTGYIDYILNCIESLKQIKMEKQLEVYCIGKEGYNRLQLNDISSNLINNEQISKFETFRTGNWSNITYYKFEIIYEKLLKYEFVCFTDGDIVYENNCFFDYLLNNIENNDMLIQSEGLEVDTLCSGFMFIKSNNLTQELFNPKNVEKYKNTKGWGDQIYINEIKFKLKYKRLPLQLFPTGNYYYNYSNNINPYMIHFNWIVGHQKKQKMNYYKKWFI